ncbi:diacylglycerol kinase family protein [Candidatus Microgenomates bacterium]|nr:MAG: diacylglycerol kinase family protein [Candidatus Microgenomates bacterium]
MSIHRSIQKSFFYAFSGFKTAFTQEPNFRIHTAMGTAAIIVGYLVKLTPTEWLLLSFTISFVLILELFNTGLEALVDIVSPDKHPKAKIAKDVSAAAVLVAAAMSIIVGSILFIPKISI